MNHERGTRIREGMPIVDSLGREAGEVGELVMGADTRRPRFITVHEGMMGRGDHLVPCEAIERVDAEGRLVLQFTRDQVELMPAYEGRPPTQEEARHAYALLGGQPDDPASGEGRHMVPFQDSIPHGPPNERFLIIAAEDRAREGYVDVWMVGGGPGP